MKPVEQFSILGVFSVLFLLKRAIIKQLWKVHGSVVLFFCGKKLCVCICCSAGSWC